jgi:hypothetical protein
MASFEYQGVKITVEDSGYFVAEIDDEKESEETLAKIKERIDTLQKLKEKVAREKIDFPVYRYHKTKNGVDLGTITGIHASRKSLLQTKIPKELDSGRWNDTASLVCSPARG